MKKLLIILFIGFTSFLQAQVIYENQNVCQISFSIYVNNKVVDTTYYFEMHNDKLDIHFVNTTNNRFNCFLEYGEEYKFVFKYRNSKKSVVVVQTEPLNRIKNYKINLEYEPTIR